MKKSRRKFIKQAAHGCTGMSMATLYSSISSLGLIKAAARFNRTPYVQNQYKALVCINLEGGNDSFNMLVPRSNDAYNEYAEVRNSAAIPQADLLAINPLNPDGKDYGVHPNMAGVQTLFEDENLAFVANVGTLFERTSLASWNAQVNVPRGIFSHVDQSRIWQTGLALESANESITGWAGRMADILHTNNSGQNISMNITTHRTQKILQGNIVAPFKISDTGTGVTLLTGASNTSFYETNKRQTIDNLMEQTYQNVLQKAYANSITNAKGNSFEFDAAIAGITPINTVFPNTSLGQQLQMVARTIAARDTLGAANQVFVVGQGGHDIHSNSGNADHYNLMEDLSEALTAFYACLEELGLENDVTSFTISDFGRKLTSNGNGTDHAWGGIQLVMGGAVNGKRIYGQYPDLYLDNQLDVGGGRLIPTTAVDEFVAELALWFGASSSDLNQIIPNINNFYDPASGGAPLGFMNT